MFMLLNHIITLYRETLTDHPLGEQPIVPERTSWLFQYSMMKLRFAHVFWGQCTHNEYLALLLSLLCVSVELCCWKDWYRKSSCLPLWYFQLFWYFNFLSLIRFWLHWITGFHTNQNKQYGNLSIQISWISLLPIDFNNVFVLDFGCYWLNCIIRYKWFLL